MGFLKRVLALAALITLVVLACAGTAAAQPRPDVPPPSSGPTLNVNEDPGFADYRRQCEQSLDNASDDGGVLGAVVDATTGAAKWALCLGAAGSAAGVDLSASALSAAASAFWGDPVGKFSKAVMEGNRSAFGTVMTFWMSVPIPALTDSAAVNGVRNITWELQLIALALGVGTGAIKVAIARKHAVADGAEETARMLLRTVFSIWTLPVLVIVLHRAGDSFAIWVIQTASGGDVAAKITAITWIDEKTGLGPVVSLALAGIGLMGSIAQLVALLIREAVLALAVGLSPIAAASSVTGTGRQTWSTMISYTVAALAFKPVASLFYAFAFWAASSKTASDAVVGAVLLAVSGLALPSLMRVIAPAVSTISAGGSQVGGLAGGSSAVAGGAAGKAAGASTSAGNKLGSRGTAGGDSSSGSSGSGTPAASGASSSAYGGRYSGSNSNAGASGAGTSGGTSTAGGASAAGSAGSSAAAGGRAASAGRAAATAGGAALTGVGAVLAGSAAVARVAGRGISGVASFTEGAISHGQVPR